MREHRGNAPVPVDHGPDLVDGDGPVDGGIDEGPPVDELPELVQRVPHAAEVGPPDDLANGHRRIDGIRYGSDPGQRAIC